MERDTPSIPLDRLNGKKNSVDDRSVQVGRKQRICTTDGYAMPLTCRGGLMYLSILDKPTDQNLERYPAVHLTGPHDHDMGMDQELYKFRAIVGHQGPLLASDPDWKGSKYNVQVEWETGEITFEPLFIIAADDPVTCAAYAKENDLLALEGQRRFRNLAKKDKVLARAIKRSKIRQVRRSQTYMFG